MGRKPAQILVCLGLLAPHGAAAGGPVLFNRDVRPILSDRCFQCHGPDAAKRVGKIRLDDPAGATADLGGRAAIVPGDPGRSEVIRRITARDPGERMPPPESGRSLAEGEIEVLRRWIAEGGTYEKHWSLIPPRPAEPPTVKNASWARNEIDLFILERLEREGLEPSPEASRETLIRRLGLDLTGLPPTPEDVDAFLDDGSPDAYEKLADRLLASPRYGERMALDWLDAARYADTNGYQGDGTRTMWAWRDWVVRALNDNMSFDRFTVEQIAGDLLPSPTQDQRIATGFHRNHMLNGEGGRIAEESRVDYVMDRVETTATVWLGLTLGCARCHDHKYDPFSQKDYYRLFSIFNNSPETGAVDAGGNANPILRIQTPADERKIEDLRREIAAAEERLSAPSLEIDAAQAEWEGLQADVKVTLLPWAQAGPFQASDFDAAFATAFEPEIFEPETAAGNAPADLAPADVAASNVEGRTAWTPRADYEDGRVHPLKGDNCATYLSRIITADRATTATLSLGSDDGLKAWLNGRQILAKKIVRAAAADQEKVTVQLDPGENRLLLKVVNQTGGYGFYFKLLHSGPPPEIIAIATTPAERRGEKESRRIRDYYRANVSPHLKPISDVLTSARARLAEIEASLPVTMVLEEMAKPRDAFVLIRGAYDKPGEMVDPGVPQVLPPLPAGQPMNRLGLARWLVDPSNPLTARVTVNRFWQNFFGTGLVKTPEDFGSQGEPPSHPELLDWLAARFSRAWDTKALHRLIVTSATYRQSSRVTPRLLAEDPENWLLARAPRWRLGSQTLRDQALHVSGLLVERIGGPPVRPYQPPGVWEDLTFGQITYRQDTGEALHRRSLYTFWRRSVGPTMFFDTPARQVCTVRQARTNTPLHALVLLNDITYVEAARVLAERMMHRPGSPEERIAWAFRALTARHPSAGELEVLLRALGRLRGEYRADPGAADRLASQGESPRDPVLDPIELAAYTGLGSVLLNLDEALSRE